VAKGYTRQLIRRVYISLDELLDEETFDEDAWEKKVYSPNVIIVDNEVVPKVWILIDGTAPEKECSLVTDPSPPPKVIKKGWDPYNDDDPNNELNQRTTCHSLTSGALALSILTNVMDPNSPGG